MKIKEQIRKLATDSSKPCFELADKTNEGSSKHCFEVADKTDQVRNIYLESGNADMSCFLILEEYKRFQKIAKQDKHRFHKISLAKLDCNFESIRNNWFKQNEQRNFISSKCTANLHATLYLEDQFIQISNFRRLQISDISQDESGNRQKVFDFINKNVDKQFNKTMI